MKTFLFIFTVLLGMTIGTFAYSPTNSVVVRLDPIQEYAEVSIPESSPPQSVVKQSKAIVLVNENEEKEKSQKTIIVSLAKQSFTAYDTDKKVFLSGLVSSASGGKNTDKDYHPDFPHNHLGDFSVYMRQLSHYSKEWHCQMPYSLFYHNGHAIHACQKSDINKLGSPVSHGCIRVHPDNARKLYKWAQIGTIVIVEP